MEELKCHEYESTIGSNRVAKECPLTNVKQMDSKSCVYYDTEMG